MFLARVSEAFESGEVVEEEFDEVPHPDPLPAWAGEGSQRLGGSCDRRHDEVASRRLGFALQDEAQDREGVLGGEDGGERGAGSVCESGVAEAGVAGGAYLGA